MNGRAAGRLAFLLALQASPARLRSRYAPLPSALLKASATGLAFGLGIALVLAVAG